MVFARFVQVAQHHLMMDLHAQLVALTKFLSMEIALATLDMPTMKLTFVSSAHLYQTDSYKMASVQFVLAI